MATIRLYNDWGSAVYTCNTPRSLKSVLNKSLKHDLKFEITRGLEYTWVRQTIQNWREETDQYEEIV